MSQQFDLQKTKQVRIDRDFHKELRIQAAEEYSTIKSVLEDRAGWKPTGKTRKDENERQS